MSNFNNRFKSLRIREDLTQGELAKKLGLSRSAISAYETGVREPDMETLEMIADFFNVDMNYLTGKEATNEEYYLSLESRQIAQEIFENKDLKMLFDATRKVSADDLKLVYEMVKRMKTDE